MWVNLLLLFLLILMSAFFSGTETAFTSLSVVQLQVLANRHGKAGKLVARLSRRPDTLLTTILFGNNLVNIGASALATQSTIRLFGNAAIGIMTGVLTLVILIFAEVTPKQIAIIHNERVCLFMAYPIRFLSIILLPFISLIGAVSMVMTRLVTPKESKTQISLEGILHMVHLAEYEGVVENYETRMVKGVFRFNDITVGAIMTHRTDLFSVDKSTTVREILPVFIEEGYSRVPVYGDDPEHIVGVLLYRDLMLAVSEGNAGVKIKELMVEPVFVFENRKVSELFFQLKREKLNLAVVMDEYGGLAGVVTLEDIVEELFGELYDENEIKGFEKITQVAEGRFRIMGDTTLHQMGDRFDLYLDHSKYVQTIAGYLTERLGNIPEEQQWIDTESGRFIIERKNGNRIESVIFEPKEQEEQGI
jgi:putative hemolysin